MNSEKEYTMLIDNMLNVLITQNEMFANLKREKSGEISDLHKTNNSLMCYDNNIINIYMNIEDIMKKLPSFFYPPLVVYFSWVRNNFDLRQKLYFEYKNKLQIYEMNQSTLHHITHSNMAQESVVFNVSLQEDNFGEIIKISPDYFLYMKRLRNDESPIGKSINIIFPDSIVQSHARCMRRTESFHRILNNPKDFFIKKFDGYLERVKFVVKISPILSKSISAVS